MGRVLRRNSSISMTGSLGMRGATLTYDETMVQGGQTIMASEATCFDASARLRLRMLLRLPPSIAPPPGSINQVFVPFNSASDPRSAGSQRHRGLHPGFDDDR